MEIYQFYKHEVAYEHLETKYRLIKEVLRP